MTISDIRIYIVYLGFLLLAESFNIFFILFPALIILNQKSLLFKKKFFYYIIFGAFFLAIVERCFLYVISNISYLKNIWDDTSLLTHLGFIIIPIVILIIFYYYLTSWLFNFDSKTKLKTALILGTLTAPWPIINSGLAIIPLVFFLIGIIIFVRDYLKDRNLSSQ